MSDYDYDLLNKQLDQAKSRLFMGSNAAFLGPLLCSINFQWSTAGPTAWTDYETIFWNPEDFLGCSAVDGRPSSILHELAHNYRLHGLRQGDRCPDTWNKACDIVINRDLLKMGYKLEWHHPGLGAHPEIPFELEEEIYDYLKAPGSPPLPNMPGPCSGMCGGMPDTMTAQVKQAVINNVVQAIHSATINGQAGQIPGNVTQIIKNFLAPKVPWEVHLQQWMTDLSEFDYSWAKPNRRYQDIYLPSLVSDESRLEHLMFFEDVSGSISDADSLRFNSELKYIWDTYQPQKLTVVQFDTQIQKVVVFNEGDSFNEIEIVGRGGTCLIPVREMIMKERPTAAVIFSDLQVTPMEPGPTCPVLWVAISNPSAVVPFGKLIHIRP